jgi:hypothetical protein
MTKFGDRLLRALDKAIMPGADETRLNSLRVKLDSLTSTGFAEKLLTAQLEQHRQRISKMPQTGNAGAKREKLLAKLDAEGISTAEQIRLIEAAIADVVIGNTTTSSTTTSSTSPTPAPVATPAPAAPAQAPKTALEQYEALLAIPGKGRAAGEFYAANREEIWAEQARLANERLKQLRSKKF